MPYNTETMIYNANTEQYQLTEEALRRVGIFLRERIDRTRCPSPEYVINGALESVSDMIYNFIHDQSTHNETQDYIIANFDGARKIIEKAMVKQAKYYLKNGNLNNSTDDNIRSKAISPEAITILNTTIRELGSSILYNGV